MTPANAALRDRALAHPGMDSASRIERAVRAVASGDPIADDVDLMVLRAASRRQLDSIGLSAGDRFKVDAWFVSQQLDGATPEAAKRTLVRARDLMDRMGPNLTQDATRSIADDTRALIDRNLRFIDGSLANPGYPGHPDYAEVGRVQSRIAMLRQLGAESTDTARATTDAQALAW